MQRERKKNKGKGRENKEKFRNERKILGRKKMAINVKMAISKIKRGKTITQKKSVLKCI